MQCCESSASVLTFAPKDLDRFPAFCRAIIAGQNHSAFFFDKLIRFAAAVLHFVKLSPKHK